MWLVNPPVRDRPAHIPYGIAMLGAVADEWGADVMVIDANIDRGPIDLMREDLKELEKQGEADIVGFSGIVASYKWQREAIRAVKKDHPNSFVISGGGLASALHDDFLKWVPELDAVCYGEGEKTLIELLDLANNDRLWGDELHKVKNLWIRDDYDKWRGVSDKPNREKRVYTRLIEARKEASILTNTSGRPLLTTKELDALPFPAWRFFHLEPEQYKNRIIPGYFHYSPLALSIEALHCRRRLDGIWERGCPGECLFCSHNLMGGDYVPEDHPYGSAVKNGRLTPLIRYFGPEYVVRCIKHMRLKFAVDFIAFMDETFLWDHKRAYKICDLLEAEDLVWTPDEPTFKWGCLGRPENPDTELLKRSRECGCTYVSYGFESSSQSNLDYIKKGTNIPGQIATLRATREAEITPVTSYIIGYPTETMQTIYDTTRFWVKEGIIVDPFFLTPYPYTCIYWQNEPKIIAKYGTKEKFVEACGDAFEFMVNLTENFTDVELLGLKRMMATHDLDGIRAHAKWRLEHDYSRESSEIVDPDPLISEKVEPILGVS